MASPNHFHERALLPVQKRGKIENGTQMRKRGSYSVYREGLTGEERNCKRGTEQLEPSRRN